MAKVQSSSHHGIIFHSLTDNSIGIKHHYCQMGIRKWTRRRDKLLQELRSINADIFCLQEVSKKSLKETYIPGLRSIGLECCGFAPTKSSSHDKGKYGHKHIGIYFISVQLCISLTVFNIFQ